MRQGKPISSENVPRLRAEQGLAGRVDDRLHPAVLAPAPRPRRQAPRKQSREPRATASSTRPPDSCAADAARPSRSRPPSPGPRRSSLPGSASRPSRTPPDQQKPSLRQGRSPGGTVDPRPPARQPGNQHAPTPKNRSRRPSSRRSGRRLSSVKDRG
jgi:hypothetical protein